MDYRGTWQNPTSVLPGDRLGSFGANGYSGSTYSTQGAMEMYAGTNLGTYIIFGTTLTPGSSRLERVRISENGNVGIGFTGPSQKLDVNGSVRGVSFLSFSDERFKTNIRKVEHALDQLVKIEGVRYQFNQQKYSGRSFPSGERDGFLAQQVQKIFPEIVSSDSEGYLAIDYISLIPIMVEAIKDLKTKIDILKMDNAQKLVDEKGTAQRFKGAYLNQNSPNPSSNSTSIEYLVPENVTSAAIVMHDFNGNQIKSYEIRQKGEGKLEIQNGELNTGLFLYTLVLDGIAFSTKRMVIIK